jgi:hypothetical protein
MKYLSAVSKSACGLPKGAVFREAKNSKERFQCLGIGALDRRKFRVPSLTKNSLAHPAIRNFARVLMPQAL